MKKLTIIVSLVLLLAMALAACGPTTTSTETSLAPTDTEVAPPSGNTGLATDTPEASTMATETPMATTVETTTVVTKTPAATETVVIPPTGAVDAGRLSNLLDFSVVDKTGQNIGKVSDFILNLGETRVQYVVVSSSAASSTTEVAAPWAAFTVQTTPTTGMVLNVDQTVLQKAPAIDLSKIPAPGSPSTDWDKDNSDYWKNALPQSSMTVSPSVPSNMAQSAGLSGVMLASKLIGSSLTAGNQSASIDDVIVDTQSGALQYLAVSLTLGNAGKQDILIPVNANVLNWDATSSLFKLNIDLGKLASIPGFAMGNLPNTQKPGWDDAVKSFWNTILPTPTP